MNRSVNVGDIVVVHDDILPRGFWKMVEELMPGTDGNVRGVVLKIARRGTSPLVTRRPIERLFPLESSSYEEQDDKSSEQTAEQVDDKLTQEDSDSLTSHRQLDLMPTKQRRRAFLQANKALKSYRQ